jgi:hypothetical protein
MFQFLKKDCLCFGHLAQIYYIIIFLSKDDIRMKFRFFSNVLYLCISTVDFILNLWFPLFSVFFNPKP